MISSDQRPRIPLAHLVAAMLLVVALALASVAALSRSRVLPAWSSDGFAALAAALTFAMGIVALVWHGRRIATGQASSDGWLLITANGIAALAIAEGAIRGPTSQLLARGLAGLCVPMGIALAASTIVIIAERLTQSGASQRRSQVLGYVQAVLVVALLATIIAIQWNPPGRSRLSPQASPQTQETSP